MTPSEIITEDAQEHGVDPERVLSFVAHQIQSGKATLMQAGESVLLLILISPSSAECHLYTQDAPLSLRKSLTHFLHTIRQSAIERLYGQADNDGIIQMLHLIGLDVQKSDLPSYNWMAEVGEE